MNKKNYVNGSSSLIHCAQGTGFANIVAGKWALPSFAPLFTSATVPAFRVIIDSGNVATGLVVPETLHKPCRMVPVHFHERESLAGPNQVTSARFPRPYSFGVPGFDDTITPGVVVMKS
jgi:hypothetical protein